MCKTNSVRSPGHLQALMALMSCTAAQSRKEITAYLKSKQLLPSGFAKQCGPGPEKTQRDQICAVHLCEMAAVRDGRRINP